MLSFTDRLDTLPHIKKPQWLRLKRLGIETVEDLLFHFPTRYEDFATIVPINELQENDKVTVEGTVTSISTQRTWKKKMLLTEALIQDPSGSLRVLWFNQKFVSQTMHDGMAVRLSGKVSRDREGLVMQSPAFERTERVATHTGRLVPVYPETAGLTSKFLRWQIALVFQKITDFADPIPNDILNELHLPDRKTSLAYLHFPKNEKQILLAEKRFAFDEMFFLQLKTQSIRSQAQMSRAVVIEQEKKRTEEFIGSLPFSLTQGQAQAVNEILADLGKPTPMNRLLNGDVGSGKTVVAAVAAETVARSGYQVAFLAPTEILAEQHFKNLRKFFDHLGLNCALLTANFHALNQDTVTRATLLKAIKNGIADIIIGTHALLQEDVSFEKLVLIVVDEQQRFGVAQRAKLQELSFESRDGSAATVPHFLTMTATPIPRTLALTLFGNLDLSLLEEVPKERKPIITRLANSDVDRGAAYAFIREHLQKGEQAFVILPLVEESRALEEVKAATVEHTRLQNEVFPEFSLGLLHGRLKGKEKEKVMREFQEKKYHILVATAVVEVGIDVPNATIMLIEDADRFGLSQLHQFRGRVGRGAQQSYCFLFPGKHASTENARLQALEKTGSGFALAEIDLKLRGPGTFLGERQSGLPDIAMESLTNMKLIQIAREKAGAVLKSDPTLVTHPLLRKTMNRYEERIHLE